MKMTLLKPISYVFVLSLLFFACGGGESKSESQEAESSASEEFDQAKSQVISDINEVIDELPPPSEVPYLLMATGSDFDGSVINPLDDVDSYTTPASKAALNLGVYTTDIGYLASYEKAQQSLEYVGAAQKLAESIGVADAMDLKMIGRFERNINNKDSLKILVDEIMEKSSSRLNALDRIHVAGLALAGSYIEGLYISTQLIQNYPDDLPEDTKNLILEPMIKIVIDQEMALDRLIKVMNDLKGEDESIDQVLADLESIKEIYTGELEQVSEQISNNTGDLVVTSSVLDNLAAKVKEIRAGYVSA
jgi:hypothetical protein